LRRYGNATTLQTIGEDESDIREVVEERYQPTTRLHQFCPTCRSHFCPHVAPHLYQPPFTKTDELDEATAAWENKA
jgi:hypothetical protein